MITEFIDKFQEIKPELLKQFSEKEPESYEDIFKQTIEMMFKDCNEYSYPDFKRITVIDHGDYQGTLIFVIGGCEYQTSNYWMTYVGYGSCSGCDTFQAYSDWDNPEESAPHMITMALHMIEEMKKIL